MIELDEKSLIILGQIARETAKDKMQGDETTHDLMLGTFIQKVVNHLQKETEREAREAVNREQSNAV